MSLTKTFKNIYIYIYIIRTTRQLVIVYYSFMFVFVSKNKLKKLLKTVQPINLSGFQSI